MAKNRILVRNFEAKAAVVQRRFVKITADQQVEHAVAATDVPVGVVDDLDAAIGARVDVMTTGISEVEAGGAIGAGENVVAGADGKAIASTTPATDIVAGVALNAGADGEFIEVLLK